VIDATGLENRHVSRHYLNRVGEHRFRQKRWPKLTVVCHTATYLFASAVVGEGPGQDTVYFPEAVRKACERLPIDRLLADAAYDAEHHHHLARKELHIRSTVIALNHRRTRKWPKTPYRRQMRRRFHRRMYGHRWHVESAFSQTKRRLGSALRSTRDESRIQEILLRSLTHDLMILYPTAKGFQQSTLRSE
jgi:hypothetical protein